MTVAWVAGEPLLLSDVDTRERAIRSAPPAAALPNPNTSEARQLRRWLVQLLAAERLIATEADDRGLHDAAVPPLDELAPDRAALLELGSIPAALLAQNPLARAVFRAVTEHVRVAPEQIVRFHGDNPDRFTMPERRIVRHAIRPTPAPVPNPDDSPLRTLRRGELVGPVEEAVFAAASGDVLGPIRDPLGWHTLRLEAIEPPHLRTLAEARAEIEQSLLANARRRAFTAWLDRQVAEHVRLAPGFEHPGDPSQPDNTHRH